MKTDLVRRHFDQRAADFEQYSDWCSNEQLFDLCVEPVEDMVPDARCLDLGGGSGWIARRDSERSRRRWVVLDLSLNMARHIRGASTFVNGDAHALPFRDCSFAHVVIRSVLHYVNAPVVLLEAKRVLTKRGHVVVAQKVGPPPDNFEWHQELLRLRRGEMTQWTDESIDAALRASGLTPISSRVFRERRKSNFDSWLSRDGTIAADSREDIRKLVIDAPDAVRRELGLEVSNGIISYDRRWQVVVARVKPPRGEITPGVVTMIVERTGPDGIQVLLQLRKKRYEERSWYRSWELPQGKIEVGETLVGAMRRELREETGLELDDASSGVVSATEGATLTTEHVTPLTCVRTSRDLDFLAVAIIVRATGTPSSIDIDREYTWMGLTALEQLCATGKIFPLNLPMLREYLTSQRAQHS